MIWLIYLFGTIFDGRFGIPFSSGLPPMGISISSSSSTNITDDLSFYISPTVENISVYFLFFVVESLDF